MNELLIYTETSRMCPSQKFLLHNGIMILKKVNEWIVSPPHTPLGIRTPCTIYNNLILKKIENDFNTSKV